MVNRPLSLANTGLAGGFVLRAFSVGYCARAPLLRTGLSRYDTLTTPAICVTCSLATRQAGSQVQTDCQQKSQALHGE
jgi:hypothetical protein